MILLLHSLPPFYIMLHYWASARQHFYTVQHCSAFLELIVFLMF